MKLYEDYSWVRGVCYNWESESEEELRRDFGYAQRLYLNSIRTWLRGGNYYEDKEKYLARVQKLIRIADEYGISVMPIVTSGMGRRRGHARDLEDWLDPVHFTEYEEYLKDLIGAIKNEPNVIMYDIMNEPTCNNYYRDQDAQFNPDFDPAEHERRSNKIWNFLHHFCAYVKALDTETPITIGHTFAKDVEPTVDDVDVISFHDYLETRKRIEESYALADELRMKYGKPLINSELCCIGRSNPYDLALEICNEHKCGWYVFELMVHGYWKDVHGIVYPDGTIRDPAIVAALFGFYRNKTDARVKANPNKEGYVNWALRELKESMTDETTLFRGKLHSSEDVLEAIEFAANLLESAEMVPMFDPPTAKIAHWRALPEEARDQDEIRDYAMFLADTLKRYCHIL